MDHLGITLGSSWVQRRSCCSLVVRGYTVNSSFLMRNHPINETTHLAFCQVAHNKRLAPTSVCIVLAEDIILGVHSSRFAYREARLSSRCLAGSAKRKDESARFSGRKPWIRALFGSKKMVPRTFRIEKHGSARFLGRKTWICILF